MVPWRTGLIPVSEEEVWQRNFRLGEELGTVERGKTADLVVVEGDPLEDLSLLKNDLRMVIHYGQIIRNEID